MKLEMKKNLKDNPTNCKVNIFKKNNTFLEKFNWRS